MPSSSSTEGRLASLETGQKSLHRKVDRLVITVENHIATDVKRMLKTMGAVIFILLSVLGTLLWPYFRGGP